MVINRFSEARGIFETDEFSVEPCMYCFGDDGGGGGGGSDEADRSYEDDFGFSSDIAGGYSGSASDIGGTDFGGGGDDDNDSRAAIAARAGVPTDTIVGSGPQGGGVVTTTGGSPVTAGRSVEQAARDLGISEAEVRSRINAAAADIGAGPTTGAAPGSSLDLGPSVGAYIDQAIADFGVGPTTGVMQDPMSKAIAAGTAVDFNIFDTPEFQELQNTNISLMDQIEDLQQGINMRQAELDALPADYKDLMPSAVDFRTKEITELQNRLDDTFKQFTDLQSQYGAQSDQLAALDEQFGLSQQQIQDQAARIAAQEEAARRNRILGIAGVSPVASSTMTQDDVYNMFGGPATTAGPRPSALGPVAPSQPTEVVPGFGESVNRAISDFMGEYYGGITEQLPEGGISKELFTDVGDFVSQPTEFLSGYSPVAQQRMQEGYLADYGLEIPNIEVFGQKIPVSVVGAAVNAIANPEYTMTQALRGGATPVYGTMPGQEGSILGATSPSGDIVYSNSPFSDTIEAVKGTFGFGPGIDPAMAEAYAKQQELADAEAARRDSGGGEPAAPAITLPDPVTEECPEGYSRDGSGVCVYQGKARVGATPYTPMAPVEISYTGLPSLAPRILRPTYPRVPSSAYPIFGINPPKP